MVDNLPVKFSTRVLHNVRVILKRAPAKHSALGVTGASEIRWQIHR